MTGDHVPRGTEQDGRLVRYLLGELPDEERDQLEAEYLGKGVAWRTGRRGRRADLRLCRRQALTLSIQ